MWSELKNRELEGIQVPASICMWNAGVIFLPEIFARSLNHKVLGVCDEICSTIKRHTFAEQFAYSYVLSNNGTIIAANDDLLHYWGNKHEWNERIDTYLAKAFLRGETIDSCARYFNSKYFLDIPVFRKNSKWYLKLHKPLARLLMNKEVRYYERNGHNAVG